ncbi:MAG: tetratricopeptide repeat protein [Planctomycetes bacterium]|nr:tetratricopeptide repeat protein [Planctomycetota bacterium]
MRWRPSRRWREALAIPREVGERRQEGIALGNRASLYEKTGRMAQAEEAHARALAIHRDVGNRRFEGIALGNLANIFQGTGRTPQARDRWSEGAALLRGLGMRDTLERKAALLGKACARAGIPPIEEADAEGPAILSP